MSRCIRMEGSIAPKSTHSAFPRRGHALPRIPLVQDAGTVSMAAASTQEHWGTQQRPHKSLPALPYRRE